MAFLAAFWDLSYLDCLRALPSRVLDVGLLGVLQACVLSNWPWFATRAGSSGTSRTCAFSWPYSHGRDCRGPAALACELFVGASSLDPGVADVVAFWRCTGLDSGFALVLKSNALPVVDDYSCADAVCSFNVSELGSCGNSLFVFPLCLFDPVVAVLDFGLALWRAWKCFIDSSCILSMISSRTALPLFRTSSCLG